MKKSMIIIILPVFIIFSGIFVFSDEDYMTESGDIRDVMDGEVMTDSGEIEEIGSGSSYMTDSGEVEDVDGPGGGPSFESPGYND